jgi:hypothetical protein
LKKNMVMRFRVSTRSKRRRKALSPCYRPRLETLEDRTLLATDVWTGAAYPNQNWSNAANWTNGVPNPGDDLVFGYSSGPDLSLNPVSINDLTPGMTLNSIRVDSPHGGYYVMGNFYPPVFGPVALQGNAITLTGGMSGTGVTGGEPVANRFTEVELNGITLAANQTFSGDLHIRSPVTQNGFTVTCYGGFVSGISFSGPFYASAPIFGGGFASAILVAPITLSGGGGNFNVNGFLLTLAGSGGSISLSGSGSINADSGNWSFFTNPDKGPYTGAINIYGATVNDGSITTVTWDINVYSGTFIANHYLGLILGAVAGPVNVYSGGTFVASGNIGGPVNIFSGTLNAPEAGPGGPSLTTGSLAFASEATFQVDLAGNDMPGRDYSQVSATSIDLGGATLSATLKFSPSSTAFVILESPNPISGTFNGLPEGAALTLNNQTFYIHYFQPSPGFPARVVLANDSRVTYTTITASEGAFPQTPLLTATVSNVGGSPVNGAAPPATGTVTFLNGITPLGGAVPLVNGVASFTPLMQAGDRSAVAIFNPSSPSYLSSNAATDVLVNPVDMGWTDVMTGDFTGDGKQDIVGRSSAGQWFVGVNNGSGFTNQLWTTWSTAVTWVDVHVGDFDGDGKADIVGRVLESGQWWVAQSTGSSFTNALWTTWSSNVTWVDVKVGDFNGDGKADIIGRVLESGQWWTAISTGSSFVNTLWTTWSTAVTWVDVQVGDFNGDGKADITGRVLESGQWWTGISTGSSFVNSLWTTWSTAVTWVDVQVGDFNGAINPITGDRIMDITGRVLESGQWWTGISTGSSFVNSLWTTWSTDVTWVDVHVADFNGDGKADITGRVLESGQWWTGISTGSSFVNSLWTTWSTDVTWVDVQVGDFSGDGKADITGRVFESGEWWTATSSGTNFSNSPWTVWPV